MLPIFRNVRKDLLNSSRFKKYLVYAVGEIVLVVLGILIALQFNKWSENYKLRGIEIKYLKETHYNLNQDLKDIDFNISFNKDRLRSNNIVLNHLKKKQAYHDSLDFHFSNLHGSTRFVPNMSAYESLKSKGLEIIGNDSLRSKITALYTGIYYNITSFESEDDHKHQYEILWPQLMLNLKYDRVWQKAIPIDHKALGDNVNFQNAIVTNIFLRGLMISKYESQKKEVMELIKLISEELKLNLE